MKIYKLIVSSKNGFQANIGDIPQEYWDKSLYEPYPFEEIDSIYLDLEKRCKKTDVLNVGDLNIEGFPISNKFVDILKKFNLLDIQFVKITNKTLSDYSVMFFNSDITDKIDYQKCNFILIDDFFEEIEILDENLPQNQNELKVISKKNAGSDRKIRPKNGYYFIDGFNIFEYDVFRIGYFDKTFYVSERVKNALEEQKITGVHFIEEPLFNGVPSWLEHK